MAVGNVEIAVGQVWRDRGGGLRKVVGNDNDPHFPWDLDSGESVGDDGGYTIKGAFDHRADLIELVRDEHGFTPWDGGECPLKPGQYADIRYRGGNDSDRVSANSDLRWTHIGTHGDIVAYKIVEAAEQPHRIAALRVGQVWLNGEGVEVRLERDGVYEDRPWRSVYVRDTGCGPAGAGVANHRADGTCTVDRLNLVSLVRDTPDSASLAEETLSALGWVFDGTTWVEQQTPTARLPEWDGEARIEMHEPAVSAPALLTAAAKHMNDRAATYDKPEGERSMAQTVSIFKAYHGIDLTEAQGWHFMQVLKDVRLFTREAYHADSAEDCIAYAALKAEAMAQEGGA